MKWPPLGGQGKCGLYFKVKTVAVHLWVSLVAFLSKTLREGVTGPSIEAWGLSDWPSLQEHSHQVGLLYRVDIQLGEGMLCRLARMGMCDWRVAGSVCPEQFRKTFLINL